jgi:putative MATE family efflux protein
MINKSKELETESISRLLLKYALPSIIASAVMSVFNIVDSIFIGHGVGTLGLSGLAVLLPLMNMMVAFSALVAIGGANLMSIRLGQKDYESAKIILGNVVTLSIIYATILNIVCYVFLDKILIFSGASTETLPYARSFMQVFLTGNIFTQLFFNLNAMLRSSAAPQKAMIATVWMVVIVIILNPIFIFGLKMGMRGSALATVLSQAIMLCYQLHHFFNKNNFIYFQKGIFRLRWKMIVKMMSIGLSPFFMNLTACLVVIIITNSLTRYGGDMAVGAYGIINRFLFFFVMIVIGLMQGMQPIVGYNYGAKLYNRTFKALKLSLMFGTLISVTGFLLGEILPHMITSMFTNDKELTEISISGMRIMMMAVPLLGAQVISTGFFQSIGYVKTAIFLSLLRQLILIIPALLIFPLFFGLNGIWMSVPISDTLATVISITLLIYNYRQLKKLTN